MEVSCVMVTGKPGVDRSALAKRAIRSFLAQDYPDKELVIVNEGDPLVDAALPANIREIRLSPDGCTLGELRNIALECCHGELVAQWDDDDVSHPTRLSRQVQLLRQKGKDCCLLLWQARACQLSGQAGAFRWPWRKDCPGIPGTILHRWEVRNPYRREGRHEDTHFWQDNFQSSTAVLDNWDAPHLYVRTYHGQNTWERRHIMRAGLGWLPEAGRQFVNETIFGETQNG